MQHRHLTYNGTTSLCGQPLTETPHDAPSCLVCEATADHPRYTNTTHTTPEWQALCVVCTCQGNGGKVRRTRDVTFMRYVACADCGADVTDADDVFADRTGGECMPHPRASK